MDKKVKEYVILIYKAILAGGAIALGGIANICSSNKIVGSLFFCIGLFLVLVNDLNLFTGKICYLLDNPSEYLFKLFLIYAGNFLGAVLVGTVVGYIDKFDKLLLSFSSGLQDRISAPWWQILLLGVLCNIMIYIAVDGYKNRDKEWKKVLSLIFGVSVFVLCGFEHSVADMFYLSAAGIWSIDGVKFIAIVTAGNILGGLLIPCFNKLLKSNPKRPLPKDEDTKNDFKDTDE